MRKSVKIISVIIGILFVGFVLLSIFNLADLRPKELKQDDQSEEQIQFAKSLIQNAISAQGLDKASQFSTYEIIGTDHWKGMMGKMGNPWDWNNDLMALRYTVGDFDGQVEVLEGDKKGFVAGIQSWEYYEKKDDQLYRSIKEDKGKIFILAALHYFFELGNRLANAPTILYAGQDILRGQEMDKVYVSWGPDVTKKYDQYVLWIGKESGLIEATEFTTRDNFMPAPAFMYGCLQFEDFKTIDGVQIPFKQTAQIGRPKESTSNYVHQVIVQKFEWDVIPISDIRPFAAIAPLGDEKPVN